MKGKGIDFHALVRSDDVTQSLLKQSKLRFSEYGASSKKYVPESFSSFRDKMSLVKKLRSYDPDLILLINEPPPSPYSNILNIPSVVFVNRLLGENKKTIFNSADKIVVPDCYHFDVPKGKKLSHTSYHSLASLHPNRFTPDEGVLDELETEPESYVFVSFEREKKGHSSDDTYLRRKEKIDLVRNLDENRKVFIDGRGSVPDPLREYLPRIPLNKYNDLLAFSELAVGTNPEVLSGAGVLGVPWIYLSKYPTPVLEEQEVHYEIGTQVEDIEKAKEISEKLLSNEIKIDFKDIRKEILDDKIDLTSWMIEMLKEMEKYI